MASTTWLWMLLVLFSGLMGSMEAYDFMVGGKQGWVLNPSQSYNDWTSRMRFLVNDTLHFKYNKGADSVLVVNKQDYDTCNTQNPIMKMDGGDSVFKLDRSGPFYFISGNKDNCDKGQKLTVVVLAVRNFNKPNPTLTPPPAAQTPATAPFPAGKAPATSPTPGSSTGSPSPATTESPPPAAQTPATSPKHASPPANSPATAPFPAGKYPATSPTPGSSTGSPSPATTESPTPATANSPTPAKSPSSSPVSPSPATTESPTQSMSPATSPSPATVESPTTTLSPGTAPSESDTAPSSHSADSSPPPRPSSTPAFAPPVFMVLLVTLLSSVAGSL